MKLLVTGAAGLLGTEIAALAAARGGEVVALGRKDLDVMDAEAVEHVVSSRRPDVVVHCAAYTNVDGAEAHPDLAMALNRDATHHVASVAERVGARFVYVSSDYVFDGAQERPYAPDAPTAPLSVYGRSKLEGERVSQELSDTALVARTSWLYGAARRNFVSAMIERASKGESLNVVEDQIGSPSWSRNVAESILDLVDRGASGIWHVADRGACSWADFAREAIRLRGIDAEVTGVSAASWGAPAARPAYSVLDLTATETLLGREMPDWRTALESFLAEAPLGGGAG